MEKPDQAFRFNFPAARTDLFAYFCALYRQKRDEKRFPTFLCIWIHVSMYAREMEMEMLLGICMYF